MDLIKTILKIVGLVTIGLMIVAPFLFNRSDEPVAGKTEIQYWHSTGQKEQYPYYLTAFNSISDSIQVKSVVIPWQEQEKKVLTALLSGNPPDVVNQFSPVVKWASEGWP